MPDVTLTLIQEPSEPQYWVQTQAPAGNWVDSLGTDDLEQARGFAAYEQDHRKVAARIVTKSIFVVS